MRRIANVKIHVERAIQRLKCFKILSNIIPGQVKNVDDILTICAGLCNLQPDLINDAENEEDQEFENASEVGTDSEDNLKKMKQLLVWH